MWIKRGAHPRGLLHDHPGGFADDFRIQRLARPPVRGRAQQRRQRLNPAQCGAQRIETFRVRVHFTHNKPSFRLMSMAAHRSKLKKTIPSPLRNITGARIRTLRDAANPPVSQDDLAGRLAALFISLDRSAISRIESGDRYVMDYELKGIAKCLKVPIEQLFQD